MKVMKMFLLFIFMVIWINKVTATKSTVLASNSTSANFFQSGGHGSTSAIQLRGLPKRYSTVYIDGVKMSDPSSVSGDFDFNHILTNQI